MRLSTWIQILILIVAVAIIIIPFAVDIKKIVAVDANYLAACWSLSGSILLGYFAWVTYSHSKILEKPVLTAETIKAGNFSYYVIKNSGQVPALNVKLFTRLSKEKNQPEFEEMILC